jgi:hypothetical protein
MSDTGKGFVPNPVHAASGQHGKHVVGQLRPAEATAGAAGGAAPTPVDGDARAVPGGVFHHAAHGRCPHAGGRRRRRRSGTHAARSPDHPSRRPARPRWPGVAQLAPQPKRAWPASTRSALVTSRPARPRDASRRRPRGHNLPARAWRASAPGVVPLPRRRTPPATRPVPAASSAWRPRAARRTRAPSRSAKRSTTPSQARVGVHCSGSCSFAVSGYGSQFALPRQFAYSTGG